MLEAKRRLDDALTWIERGIAVEGSQPFPACAGNNLAGMGRALLKKLGRGQEIWTRRRPSLRSMPGTPD